MKIEVTKVQLEAIRSLAADCYSMIGQGDPEPDRIWGKHVDAIDRMLKKNGLPPVQDA